MKTSDELRREAAELDRVEREKKRRQELSDLEEFRKNQGVDVYIASDYCGLTIADLCFYYGYEETVCPIEGHQEDCEDYGCDKREWAFTATKNGKELLRIPTSKLWPSEGEDVHVYLLAGIGLFFKHLKKSNTKEKE